MPAIARDAAQLDDFERTFGIRLPTDYREFALATQRGARLGSYELDGQRYEIADLYGFDAPQPLHDLVARRIALRGLVPHQLQAVARDKSGGLLCIGVMDPRPGGVYLVRVPKDRQTPVPARMIAVSFSEFLRGLTPPPTEPPSRPTTKLRKA